MCVGDEVQIFARTVFGMLRPLHGDGARLRAPVRRQAFGSVPGYVEAGVAVEREGVAPQHGAAFAEGNHQLKEAQKAGVGFRHIPVEPAYVVVLAIGIVVAKLGATQFVTGQEHWYAVREKQNGKEVLALAATQFVDGSVRGWSLDTAVPT